MDGVMAIETSVAVVTVNVAEPLTLPYAAVMVVVPALSPLAKPPALINAKFALEELQVTCDVRSCVLLSVKTPVAVNWTFPLIPTTVVTGVTTMFDRVAAVTVNDAVAVMEP